MLISRLLTIFGGLLILLSLIGYLFFSQLSIDFHMHDTYFVVGYVSILVVQTLFVALLIVAFKKMEATNKPFPLWFTAFYLLVTIGFFLLLLITPALPMQNTAVRIYDLSINSFQPPNGFNTLFTCCVLFFVPLQLVFWCAWLLRTRMKAAGY